MPELEPAKDDDMSCELSTKDRWEGCTMDWLIIGAIYKGGKFNTGRYFGKDEFFQECIKNPNYLVLLKKYVSINTNVQHIYEEIESRVINTTTDDDSSSSSSVSSSAKKVGTFLVRNVTFNKSSSPNGKKRPIDETTS
eukprot:14490172-Ditylum_brightwellii.AAC.1